MADVVFLATIVGFFLLCVAYVAGCQRIIGGGEVLELPGDDEGETPDGSAARSVPDERAA
jgi:hypothetical protein